METGISKLETYRLNALTELLNRRWAVRLLIVCVISFLMGLFLGISFINRPSAVKEQTLEANPTYVNRSSAHRWTELS